MGSTVSIHYIRWSDVVSSDLLSEDAAVQLLLQLLEQDAADGDVARQGVRAAEMAGQRHQQMEDSNHVFGVDGCSGIYATSAQKRIPHCCRGPKNSSQLTANLTLYGPLF